MTRATVWPAWHGAPVGPFISLRQDILHCVRRCDVIHYQCHVLSHWSAVLYSVHGGSCRPGCQVRCASSVFTLMLMIHSRTSTCIVMISRHPLTNLECCVLDTGHWMSSNRLKLNTDKTELLAVCQLKSQLCTLGDRYTVLKLGADTTIACSHVRLLGINILSDLSLGHLVSHLCRLLSTSSTPTSPAVVGLPTR